MLGNTGQRESNGGCDVPLNFVPAIHVCFVRGTRERVGVNSAEKQSSSALVLIGSASVLVLLVVVGLDPHQDRERVTGNGEYSV